MGGGGGSKGKKDKNEGYEMEGGTLYGTETRRAGQMEGTR